MPRSLSGLLWIKVSTPSDDLLETGRDQSDDDDVVHRESLPRRRIHAWRVRAYRSS